MSSGKIIVLAGASGDLGGRIARELRNISNEIVIRALVRKHSASDPKLLDLERSGVELVLVEYDDASKLVQACEGAHCVVSALAGMRDVIVETQGRLLEAAIQAHVPRFIPSDYALDFLKIAKDENRNLGWRQEFKEQYLDKHETDIQITSILNGPFAEVLDLAPIVFKSLGRVIYWGEDAGVAMDFTTKDNVAQFTARVALDQHTPRFLRISGDEINAKELATAAAAPGEPLQVFCAGSLNTLRRITSVMRACSFGSDSTLYPPWVGMQYMQGMFSGQGKLSPLDNSRYPEIKWTTVEELFKSCI